MLQFPETITASRKFLAPINAMTVAALGLVMLALGTLGTVRAQCNGRHVISAVGGVSGTFASNPNGTNYQDGQNCEWLIVGL